MIKNDLNSRLRRDAQAIYAAAVRAVQAEQLLAAFDLGVFLDRPLEAFRRVIVVGAGKAAMAMAGAVEQRLGQVDTGVVVIPEGYAATLPATEAAPQQIRVVEAGHPLPTAAGVQAAQQVLHLAQAATADDLVLVMLSGGGSALWPLFAEAITLEEAQETFRILLHSGADIHAINTVRKHLSRIGGGQLALAAFPAQMVALVLSDVVGDDLNVIASGPTVPDSTTFADARDVLHRFGLWEMVPNSVRHHLEHAASETPSSDHPTFQRVQTHLVGTNQTALQAAAQEAERRGYRVRVNEAPVMGEAREVGTQLAQHVIEQGTIVPTCWLSGGETTVTVTGTGQGGRNQEVALAAALALHGTEGPLLFLSGGTDGIDGPTDAAGAWATPATVEQGQTLGLNAEAALHNNDAYTFFERLDALLMPGPTHTNVMDIQVVLKG